MYLPFKTKRLNIGFEVDRLRTDLRRIPEHWWVSHSFDDTKHDVVLLVTNRGRLTSPDGTDNHLLLPPFLPTEYLKAMPYFNQVLHSFGLPPSRARLMRVGPNETVKPHQDRHPHWNDKVRVHIPIETSLDVMFHVWSDNPLLRQDDKVSVHFAPGEAWVFNGWYFHAVSNPSTHSRIHLVGDFEVKAKIFELVFAGCTPEDIAEAGNFAYPPYSAEPDVLRWAGTGETQTSSR